jgi:hypothetical protein
VFRKPSDIPQHLDDILAAAPKAVWLQSGITHTQVTLADCALQPDLREGDTDLQLSSPQQVTVPFWACRHCAAVICLLKFLHAWH